MAQKEIIFVVDPMCSWCWGFAPVMEELRATLSDSYGLSLVMGGLRTKGEMVWDRSSREYLRRHWEEVEKRTGQTFRYGLFEKEEFEYDTYPACKAVVTVRELFGMQSAFDYLHRIQEAFYTRGEDVTNVDVLITVLKDTGSDSTLFKIFFESERVEILTQHDFSKARSMGANAFPSVVIIDEEGHMVCQKGYRSLLEMKKILKEYDA